MTGPTVLLTAGLLSVLLTGCSDPSDASAATVPPPPSGSTLPVVPVASSNTGTNSPLAPHLPTDGTVDRTLPVAGPTDGPPSQVTLPPVHVEADYQLGGAYPPSSGTRLVVRDRTAAALPGVYSVCYVNAFQAQPGELSWWRTTHESLLLHDPAGDVVIDPDWGEALLDISTAARRTAIAKIMDGWFAGCADRGFEAVEPDNLDSWTRSRGLLDAEDAVAMAEELVASAHAHHLAIAQKNTVELSTRLRRLGFDFATAEECSRYRECATYATTYQNRVLVVEYRRQDLDAACADPAVGGALSVVLRDVELRTPSQEGYLRATC
jgi:hypothetical protein